MIAILNSTVVRTAKVLIVSLLTFIVGTPIQSLRAQSAPEKLERFEVASIRPDDTIGQPSADFNPDGFRATHVPLKFLIEIAYEIRPEQLSGGASWTDSQQFTVVAKRAESAPAQTEEKAINQRCLQILLRERFHLVLKRDTQRASGYVLAVDGKGSKLATANDPLIHQLRQTGRWQLRAKGLDMSTFATFLSVHLQTAVSDETGLDGHYDFQLNWTPNPVPASVESLNGLPEETLVEAVREQLGLRLKSAKVGQDRYTIERAEKPTEN